MMDDKGFDVNSVVKRLKVTFTVEHALPLHIKLMLAHLMRAEMEAAELRH